ncbi:hypothetical protein ACFL60_05950 [Candidatus Omnitrophota bacterium]
MSGKNCRTAITGLVLVLMTIQSLAETQSIGNITCNVTEDAKIVINYQLSEQGKYTVKIFVSLDGGENYTIDPQTLTGDVGKGIVPGTGKEIVWDVFKDVKKLSGDMVILLQAEKEPEKPVHWLYVVASMLFIGGAIVAMDSGKRPGSIQRTAASTFSYGLIKIEVTFPE